MTKKKKTFVVVSISLLVIIASGFSFVMITGACGNRFSCSPMDGHRFHKRGIPPFMHKEIGSFMLWRMDKETKALDLSETQQQKYNNFRSKLEATINNGIETKMGFRQQAITEFDKENPDLSVLSGEIQADIALMSSSISENLALFTNFYNSLDTGQQKIITNKIKERIESHKRYGSCYQREI
jgi:LTXXQ motif family protein